MNRQDIGDRAKERNVEVRREEEIRTRCTNQAWQIHLLGNGIVRKICDHDAHVFTLQHWPWGIARLNEQNEATRRIDLYKAADNLSSVPAQPRWRPLEPAVNGNGLHELWHDSSMLVHDALERSGVDRTDAQVLLAGLLRCDRTWLLTHDDVLLTQNEQHQWQDWVNRRRHREPVAYILGRKEFYGRSFLVNDSVMIPRPATECLIETVLRILSGNGIQDTVIADSGIVIAASIWADVSAVKTIVDIGTGSGCIAITLACERPELICIATDTSQGALKVAIGNATRHGVEERIRFVHTENVDFLSSIDEPFLIAGNPPYIPDGTSLVSDVVDFEPQMALFGGRDGTDIIRSIMKGAQRAEHCIGVVCECKAEQASIIAHPTSALS